MKEISIKQYLLRGGAWAFTGRVLTSILGLMFSGLLARLLTPEEMGTYFLAFNLATFFSIFAGFGLESSLIRFVAEAIGRREFSNTLIIIRNSLFLALLSSTGTIFLYFAASPLAVQYLFKSNGLQGINGYVAIWLLLLTFQKIFSEIFRSVKDIQMAVLTGGLFTSAISVFFLTLYFLLRDHATLTQVLSLILSAGILNIFFSCWGGYRKSIELRSAAVTEKKGADTVGVVAIIVHSWPLFINAMMTFLLSQSSIWIVSSFCPADELAIYGAVSRMVLLTGLTLSIVNAVVPPMIAHLNVQNKKQQLEKLLQATATISVIPSTVLLFTFFVCSDWILNILFGDFYRSGGNILIILSIGQLINVFVGSCGYALIIMGFRRTVMLISIISTIIAFSISLILVKSYGSIGVAIGYSIALVVQQLSMLILARYKCGIWTHASFRYIKKYFELTRMSLI